MFWSSQTRGTSDPRQGTYAGAGEPAGNAINRMPAIPSAFAGQSYYHTGWLRSGGVEVSSLAIKVVSWNIGGRVEPWHSLLGMDEDVALLQEASQPPENLARPIAVDPAPWRTAGWTGWPRRTAVARLSDRVEVEWIAARSVEEARPGDFVVSRPGTVTAARVCAPGVDPFIAVSMYSIWESPHASTNSGWIVSDASAHRVVSDLSAFIGRQHGHRILAAGDLNILHGHGEGGSRYWAGRYRTVFYRMEALGLEVRGSAGARRAAGGPMAGRAVPRQRECPHVLSERRESGHGHPPAGLSCLRPRGMADCVRVRALNDSG